MNMHTAVAFHPNAESRAPIPEAPAGDVDAAAGPVAVELHYHVRTDQREAFVQAIGSDQGLSR